MTAALVFAAGLATKHTGDPGKVWLLQCALLVTLPWAILFPRGAGRGAAVFLGVPFLVGTMAAMDGSSGAYAQLRPGPHTLTGTIHGPPRPFLDPAAPTSAPAVATDFTLGHLVLANGESSFGHVRVRVPGTPVLARGDRLRILAWQKAHQRRIYVSSSSHVTMVQRARNPLATLDRWRHHLRERAMTRFSPSTFAWVAALALGDRGFLPPESRSLFRRIGQSHLLAISGLHIGIAGSLIVLLSRALGARGGTVSLVGTALAIAGYAALTGADPPALRAALLGIITCVSSIARRRAGLLNGLAIALIALGVSGGESAERPAFLFSFSAVLGIALATQSATTEEFPLLAPRRTSARGTRWRDALRVSTAAWLAVSIPLLWWTPDTVPWSPLFALALIPVFTVLLVASLTAVLLPASAADPLIEVLLNCVLFAVNGSAQLFDLCPGTPTTWPPLPKASLALGLAGGFCWFCAGSPPWRRLAVALVALAIVPALRHQCLVGGELVSVGRGQALVLWAPKGTLLYDCGSMDHKDGGARAVRSALWAAQRTHVDLVLLSHAHRDHINGLLPLLEHVSVGTVAVGPRFNRQPAGRRLLRRVRAAGVNVRIVRAGDRLQAGDWNVAVIHPPERYPGVLRHRVNDDSLAIRVTGCGLDLVATGDLQSRGLAQLRLSRPPTILLLPHHGRYDAGLISWLHTYPPQRAIAATSRVLPPRTLSVLRKLRMKVFHTTPSCSVRLRRRDGRWRIRGVVAP